MPNSFRGVVMLWGRSFDGIRADVDRHLNVHTASMPLLVVARETDEVDLVYELGQNKALQILAVDSKGNPAKGGMAYYKAWLEWLYHGAGFSVEGAEFPLWEQKEVIRVAVVANGGTTSQQAMAWTIAAALRSCPRPKYHVTIFDVQREGAAAIGEEESIRRMTLTIYPRDTELAPPD